MKSKKSREQYIRCSNNLLLLCKMTRKKAMDCFCMECMGWEDSPRDCGAPLCPIYSFRPGKLHKLKGTVDPETIKTRKRA